MREAISEVGRGLDGGWGGGGGVFKDLPHSDCIYTS